MHHTNQQCAPIQLINAAVQSVDYEVGPYTARESSPSLTTCHVPGVGLCHAVVPVSSLSVRLHSPQRNNDSRLVVRRLTNPDKLAGRSGACAPAPSIPMLQVAAGFSHTKSGRAPGNDRHLWSWKPQFWCRSDPTSSRHTFSWCRSIPTSYRSTCWSACLIDLLQWVL